MRVKQLQAIIISAFFFAFALRCFVVFRFSSVFLFFDTNNRFECTKELKALLFFRLQLFSFHSTLKGTHTRHARFPCYWLLLSFYSCLFLVCGYHFVCCSSCNWRAKLYFPERLLPYKDIFSSREYHSRLKRQFEWRV